MASAGCRRSRATSRAKKKFKRYPIGYFHIDIAEVQTERGQALPLRRHRPHLQVRLRRAAREGQHAASPRDFLRALVAAVPYKIHTVLTDNGTHFTDPSGDGWTPEDIKAMLAARSSSVPRLRTRLRRARHRAPADQAAPSLDQWPGRAHEPHHQGRHRQALPLRHPRPAPAAPRDFVAAYNFGRRLKTLKGLTPYEFICKCWTSEPERFTLNPLHQMPGLNT